MKQIFLIFLILSMGCLQQSEPLVSGKLVYIYPTSYSVYDLEIYDDTLYVANGKNGLQILKINMEESEPFGTLFSGNLIDEERFVDIVVSEDYLFLLEKLDFTNATTYVINRDLPLNPYNRAEINCHRYQSKIVFTGSKSFSDNEELIIVRKILSQYDENDRYSLLFIAPFGASSGLVDKKPCIDIILNKKINEEDIDVLYDTCDDCIGSILDCNGDCGGIARIDACGNCSGGNTELEESIDCIDCNGDSKGDARLDACGNCSGGLTGIDPCDCNKVINGNSYINNCGNCISNLNYDLSDIEYKQRDDGEFLYLTNSNEKYSSVDIFRRESEDTFSYVREDSLLSKPLTIKVYEDAYIVGLADDKGAYIALLDQEGKVENKLFIASGFTIQDIRYDYSTNLLTLSAGYDGVLVYDWSGFDEPIPRAIIASGYAYSALVFDYNKIIVGTKNGIEIYEI